MKYTDIKYAREESLNIIRERRGEEVNKLASAGGAGGCGGSI